MIYTFLVLLSLHTLIRWTAHTMRQRLARDPRAAAIAGVPWRPRLAPRAPQLQRVPQLKCRPARCMSIWLPRWLPRWQSRCRPRWLPQCRPRWQSRWRPRWLTRRVVGQSAADQLVAGQSAAGQPVVGQSVADQPAVGQPALISQTIQIMIGLQYLQLLGLFEHRISKMRVH